MRILSSALKKTRDGAPKALSTSSQVSPNNTYNCVYCTKNKNAAYSKVQLL